MGGSLLLGREQKGSGVGGSLALGRESLPPGSPTAYRWGPADWERESPAEGESSAALWLALAVLCTMGVAAAKPGWW